MEYLQTTSWKICSAWMFFVSLDIMISATQGKQSIPQTEIENHLEMGRLLLSKGQLQDALSHYHAAVEGDSNNYLTYFKRGTVYLALGKSKFAVLDFDKVLELKPDFTAARMQRGNALLKQADLELAREDFQRIYQEEGNEEARMHLMKIDQVSEDINLARMYISSQNYPPAIDLLTRIIEVCPWSSEIREMRSNCYVATGETLSAILDLRSTTKLLSDNTEGFLKLSLLHYNLGQAQDSLKEVRDCLKLDPEHPQCFPHYKKVKKIDKLLADCQLAIDSQDYRLCIDSALKVLKTETEVQMIILVAKEKLCYCYLQADEIKLSLQSCREALEIHKSPSLLCDRAEAYLASDLFDEAIRDYHEALDIDDGFQRAKEGIQKAQRLQKQSERRDYYKILGVSKKATKQQVHKAYRKLAMQWHPDNFQEGDEKKKAEKKFIDIAAAKEVLTDPEKRKKFDEGQDPLDPENPNNHHEGFNPFQQFHQFHGSPFQFKFNFN
uniref:J domain-containing protein n=1 Tax=Clastoptera arizonana TaxID=38151 RepID=A0A1B6C8F2_9HEMI